MENKDLVCDLPDEMAVYKKEKGQLPEGVIFHPGYVLVIPKQRYFIHTRAMLPLKDIEHGVGFGLWVEVSRDDFGKYNDTAVDDEKYKNFECEGTLANNWPGFMDTLGMKVKVRAISVDQKVYIWQVLDKPNDMLLETALLTDSQDEKMKERIRGLVTAYVNDAKNGSL